MTLPTDDYVRITAFYTGGAVPSGAANTFCFVADSPIDPEDAATSFATNFGPVVENLTTLIQVTSVLAKVGPDETGPSAQITVNLPGAYGGSPVPPNTSVLVTKNTNLGGRKGKGRVFLPGFREDQVDGAGTITGSTVTAINVDLASFLAGMTSDGYLAVLEHGPSGPLLFPTFVSSFNAQGTVATQRRRLRR